MKKKLLCALAALALMISSLGASLAESAALDISDYFSKKDLSGEWDADEAKAISLTGSLTITEGGAYVLSGEIPDGMITVNVSDEEKVQLVLSGVKIASSSSAAILVENADKVFITLAPGTENELVCAGFDETSDVDGAIFARDDLVLNGEGAMTIASAHHGIVAKDDLKITGGDWTITAQAKGVRVNDSLRMAGGTLTIDAQKDAIQAKNDEDAEKGYVLLAGGTLNLTAGGGAENGAAHVDNDRFGGRGQWYAASTASEDTDSAKGVKASGNILIFGVEMEMDTADDAIHANGDVTVSSGSIRIRTGDDGVHADNALTIDGGTIQITQSYEGLEASAVTINGGDISLTASDDGLNAAGGKDSSGWGWNDMFASDGSSIVINGGSLYVNASGDGIDSNGDLTVNGGVVVVSGPTNSGNSALDANGVMAVNGGTVIAAGAVGMVETFGSTSAQVSFLTNLSGAAGSEITVADGDGKVILSGTVEKNFQCVVISCPELAVGETYTVSSGSQSVAVTPSGVSSGGSGFGGFGGFGGGRNGFGGGGQSAPGQPGENFQGMPEQPQGGGMPEQPQGGMQPGQGFPGGFGGGRHR